MSKNRLLKVCPDCEDYLSGDISGWSMYYSDQEIREKLHRLDEAMKEHGYICPLFRVDEFSDQPCDLCGTHTAGQRIYFKEVVT